MLLETDGHALAFLDDINEMDDSDQTFTLIENWLSEYPMHIEVDGEIWRGVDKHSRDRYRFTVAIPHAVITDDVLEMLPDVDDHVQGAEWVVRNNNWTVDLSRVID